MVRNEGVCVPTLTDDAGYTDSTFTTTTINETDHRPGIVRVIGETATAFTVGTDVLRWLEVSVVTIK